MTAHPVTDSRVRVNYSEVDQMGVAYHARYLVWLDIARTEHLRAAGMAYKALEARGYRLVVGSLQVRYRQPARYDDPIRVRCWTRSVESRRIVFGYALTHDDTGQLLATATTDMLVLNDAMTPTRLPDDVSALLVPVADPVRLA